MIPVLGTKEHIEFIDCVILKRDIYYIIQKKEKEENNILSSCLSLNFSKYSNMSINFF